MTGLLTRDSVLKSCRMKNLRYKKQYYLGRFIWCPITIKSIAIYNEVIAICGVRYKGRDDQETSFLEYYSSMAEIEKVYSIDPHVPYIIPTYDSCCCIYVGKRVNAMHYYVGDKVDAMDLDGNWWESVILEKNDMSYKVHYKGWNHKWDQWVSYLSVAPLFSITRNWRVSVLIGDTIEKKWGNKWFPVTIVNKKADMIEIKKNVTDQASTEWVMILSDTIMPYGTHVKCYPHKRLLQVFDESGGIDVWAHLNRVCVSMTSIPPRQMRLPTIYV